MKERITWLDVAKGLCMISIVLGHMGINEINAVVFSYHLPLFFLLSGYTLKPVVLNGEYINKKFKRLMTPYFVTCFCILLMDIFNCIFLYEDMSIYNITAVIAKDLTRSFWASGDISNFAGIELGGRIGALWFLPAMFWAVIIVQFIFQCSSGRKTRWCIALLLAAIGVISARFIWLPFSIQSALMAVPNILLGYEFRENNVIEKVKWKHFVFCLGLFLVGLALEKTMIIYVIAYMQDYILTSVVSLSSCICVIYIAQKLKENKLLQYTGENSLYFLCIHLFILETSTTWLYFLLDRFGIYNNATSFSLQIILIYLIIWLLLKIKFLFLPENKLTNHLDFKRDPALDIAKGFLICIMLVAHMEIAPQLRTIVYSFHMPAFIFFSGYFFKKTKYLKQSLLKLCKAFLLPYSIFIIIYCIMNQNNLLYAIKSAVCGISFSSKVFNHYVSVEPVYFILLLFLVRLFYLIIDRYISNELTKNLVVLGGVRTWSSSW